MKPILFNTSMVRAILDGRKTVTRRVVKPQPKWSQLNMRWDWGDIAWWRNNWNAIESIPEKNKPFKPGDILYVRETWGFDKNNWLYKADFPPADLDRIASITKWLPSIHMPKEAARIFLRVTNVRVERLHDITPEQIDAEGCKEYAYDAETCVLKPSSPVWFELLWDSTIKEADKPQHGWDANPWVWVIEFERITREEAYHEIP